MWGRKKSVKVAVEDEKPSSDEDSKEDRKSKVALGRKSRALSVKAFDSIVEKSETSGEVRIEVEHAPHVQFHEKAVKEGLSHLARTARVFIARNSRDSKRFDVVDDMGTLVYRLVDFTKELDLHAINFCLMTGDGKKQLLILQGDLGLLGLKGNLVARYPGSLPGDHEKIFGSAVIQSSGCHPACKLKDSHKKDLLELQDKSKRHVLNPWKKCRAVEYEAVKPGGLVVFGRIEEREPKDLKLIRKSHKKHGKSLATLTSVEPQPLPVGLNRKSLGESPILASLNPEGRRSTLSGGHSRRGSVETVKITANSDHSVFCIGFKKDADFTCRALLITAHILVNFDFIGTNRKCTRFVCSVLFWAILVSVLLSLVVVGVLVALHFIPKK